MILTLVVGKTLSTIWYELKILERKKHILELHKNC